MTNSRRTRLIQFGIVFLIGAAVGFGIAQIRRQSNALVTLGSVDGFPPGSVTEINLPAYFYDPMRPPSGPQAPDSIGLVSPIPVFVVHDPAAGFLALYNRDTHSTCRLRWQEDEQRFYDPCHGAKYTRTGEYLEGPAPRGMDRFQVIVSNNGILQVNVTGFQMGSPHG